MQWRRNIVAEEVEERGRVGKTAGVGPRKVDSLDGQEA